MSTYDYFCEKCDKNYEVIKSMKEYDGKDPCPICGNTGSRIFSCKILLSGTKIEDAEYNPALGAVTKNAHHRKELAKQLGVVEVGNDFGSGEKLQKHLDDQRISKIKKAYDDI